MKLARPILPHARVTSADDRESDKSVALGVINVEDTVRGALGEADIKLITTVASALSVALENATLIKEWQQRGNRLELVNGVARAVAAQLDLPGVLRAARESLQGLAPADRATLSLLTEDGQSMEIAAVEGVGVGKPGLAQKGSLIPLDDFEPKSVLSGEWLVIEHLTPDGSYVVGPQLYEAGLRSHVAIPLLAGESVVGLLALSSLHANAYTQEHMLLLESIAPHLATAVQNAQLYRQIKLRAETDNLTKFLICPLSTSGLKSR